MALPILDGNQTAATLSTVLTGGEHIPAHTVVSLGSQAITDVRSAVSGSVVSISNFPATQPVSIASVTIGNTVTIGGTVKVDGAFLASGVTVFPSLFFWYDSQLDQYEEASSSTPLPIAGTVTVGNSVTIGSLPSGALTTRFGSVTTANTAQITSAVTNTSRKYLLAQNISAGTVTIGIGFSPTTTQGIQLPAGGGLTFDSFCPTGAVYWLGAVTGAAYTILEG